MVATVVIPAWAVWTVPVVTIEALMQLFAVVVQIQGELVSRQLSESVLP